MQFKATDEQFRCYAIHVPEDELKNKTNLNQSWVLRLKLTMSLAKRMNNSITFNEQGLTKSILLLLVGVCWSMVDPPQF